MEWIAANWWWLALVLGALISVLNAVTAHWSERTGLVRVLLLIVDVLSLVKTNGGKLPGVPTGRLRMLLPLALVGAMMGGCCTTAACYLHKAHVGLAAADGIALELIGKKCMAEAVKCGPVGSANCPGWQKCDVGRAKYKTTINGIDGGLGVLNRTLKEMEVP